MTSERFARHISFLPIAGAPADLNIPPPSGASVRLALINIIYGSRLEVPLCPI